MKNELLPIRFQGISETVYAGFGPRLGAKILDFLIMVSVMGILLYISGLSKSAYFYTVIPNLLIGIFFEVCLVKIYGGTPGKLIMGLKIIQKNGDDVDWKPALYRYSVELFLAILAIYVMILTLNMIDDSTYASLGFMERNKLISTINPLPNTIQTWLSGIWIVSGLIVLLTNARKRTTHDFIAGTVVVKSIFIDKIREIANSSTDEEVE